ncbi:hypothetical protein SESBI_51035 [Sesbania bispinosa]|nr:hypothetical protein SESBI_51035 [Sesbania bispinosa]
MTKANENPEFLAAKTVRVPPKRGQIKAKMMTEFMRMVEAAGRAMCRKEKVAEESHPSQPHDTSHA